MTDTNLHPEVEQQKRRSTRIVQAVPLTVTGVDALGRPFQERTSTLIINCHGCRYQSKHYVLKNMWVTFEVPHNEAGRDPRSVRARVTWIQRPRTVRELFQIGVELEISGNVWGIAFPPGDWFPFPEATTTSEVAEETEAPEVAAPASSWKVEVTPAPESPELPEPELAAPVEDNLRVLPSPGGMDASLQLSRQIARLVAEAKLQVQGTVRETATRAVAAETRPLLAALQSQMKDAAEKSVASAIAEQVERMQRESIQRLESDRAASIATMREEWSNEFDRRISEARLNINSQLAEVEGARRADFERQIQGQLTVAIEKLQSLSGNLGASSGEVRAAVEQLRKNSAEAVEQEERRWQEFAERRSAEARTRLEQLQQEAARISGEIAAATSQAESGWRGRLEAELAAAGDRWNEKVDSSINTSVEEAARRVAERLSHSNQQSLQLLEEQAQNRIAAMGGALSQITTEAESTLGRLRVAIGHETAKSEAAISDLRQTFDQLNARRGEFAALIQSASDEMARRSETLLEAQSSEMNRRSESAVAGMVQRLQPVLESAGQQTIERLAAELEQRLGPQIVRATEMLSKLTFSQEETEKALNEHRERVWQVTERGVQDSVARAKDLLVPVEKEFAEAARTNSAKWLGDLETKANETSHSTFEALFKSADWYEKKVQTQMQATLEKGVEQAASGLREKAGELSGLFASELDHYSRSYVEHAQGQMDENAKDAAERTTLQLSQASEAAATNFATRIEQLIREQLDALKSKTSAAFDQTVSQSEAHVEQVRAKLRVDTGAMASEFQAKLEQQTAQSLAQGKQELESQADLAKESLRNEAQWLDNQLRNSLQAVSAQAVDEYKQRLENASNSWLLTTVSKLNQQSESLIDQLASSTEQKLRGVCGNVFADMGETLRLRLAGFSAQPVAPATPALSSPETHPQSPAPVESKPDEQK